MILNELKTNDFIYTWNQWLVCLAFIEPPRTLDYCPLSRQYLSSSLCITFLVCFSYHSYIFIDLCAVSLSDRDKKSIPESHVLEKYRFDGFAFELLTFVYLLSLSLLLFHWTRNALERTEKRTINQNSCI